MPSILIVEDNEFSRDMLSRRLGRKGYQVLTALDGAEAIGVARSRLPDLIVMDLSLPVMDGWQATRRLKDAPDTCHIPVIVLTAHAMAGDRERALQAGCDEYETKPLDFSSLLQKIQILLDQKGNG